MRKLIKAARSSRTGKFVSSLFARANPDTTQVETIERKPTPPMPPADND